MFAQKTFRFLILGALVILGSGLVASLATAEAPQSGANFVVNSLADDADANIGDGICATAGSVCTLRAAIVEANAISGADVISFAPNISSTIFLTSNLPGITDSVSIVGPGINVLTIDGFNNGNFPRFSTFSFGNAPFSYTGPKINFSLSGLSINRATTSIYVSTNASVEIKLIGVSSSQPITVFTGTLVLRDSLIFNNGVSGGGGGLYNVNGNVTIYKSTFTGNSSTFGGGGAIYATGPAITTIYDSAIYSNTTGNAPVGASGGGINNFSPNSHMTIVNTTIAGNSATQNANSTGGGIYNRGVLTLTNVTLSNNSAQGLGGGLYALTSTVTVQNSIIANSNTGGDCRQSGSTINNGGFNLIEDNSCGFTGGADPLLGPLQDNGGPTWTQALLNGSPAIDAGNPAGCGPALDQRGYYRTVDGDGAGGARCDIGAFEFNSTLFVPNAFVYLPLIQR